MESQFKRCLSVLFRVLDPLICCLLVMPLENSEVELLNIVFFLCVYHFPCILEISCSNNHLMTFLVFTCSC